MFLRAYRTIDASNVIHFLTNLITQFMTQYKILWDNHPTFTSSAVQEFLKTPGIKNEHSVAYVPHTNGLAENAMQALHIAILGKLQEDYTPSKLPTVKFITMAHNTARHPLRPNQCSPFYLLFGFHPNTIERSLQIHSSPTLSRELEIQRLNIFRESIPHILHANLEQYSKFYNRTKTTREFQIGDLALVKKLKNSKLDEKFYGPHKIVKNYLQPCSFFKTMKIKIIWPT